VQTFEPNLALMRRALGNDLRACRAELIKISLTSSRVYRVTLFHARQSRSIRETVIVKAIDPRGWPNLREAEREIRLHQILHANLIVPKPEIYFAETDAESGFHCIVMQDLAPTHRLPVHPYQWSRSELECVLHAYALLHSSHFDSLEYDWLAPRHESFLDFEKIPGQVAILEQAGIWGALPQLAELISSARTSCEKYAPEKLNLVHGDTTPTNAPLPKNLDAPATLIDWQDAGVGLPEFDLAYLDLQPYNSACLIPRSELLAIYWGFRAQIESPLPPPEERRARQLHADLVTALWLTGTASRVALHPFPPGSPEQIHWASQFSIVYNRLQTLSEEVP